MNVLIVVTTVAIISIILFGLGWAQMSSAVAYFFPEFYVKFIKIANLILEISFIICSVVIMIFSTEGAPLILFVSYWTVWVWFAWLWVGSRRKNILLFENRVFKESWMNTVLINALFIPFAFGTLSLSVVAVITMLPM